MIVYSVTDRQSFQEAQSIFEFTKRIRDSDMPVVTLIEFSVCVPHTNFLYEASLSISLYFSFQCVGLHYITVVHPLCR